MNERTTATRVLLVEDEPKLVRSLTQGLEEEGYAVDTANSGDTAMTLIAAERFDVAVFDWMLPGCTGIDLLRELRRLGRSTPVLLLTARDSVEDRVQGLDAGADDYLVKPFAFEELLARLRALLRRPADFAVPLRVDDLELDPVGRRASRAGTDLDLSLREFELLEYLMRNAGRTASRDTLTREVWRESESGLTNVINVYVNYLRKKLERGGRSRLIHTIRGEGYALRGAE